MLLEENFQHHHYQEEQDEQISLAAAITTATNYSAIRHANQCNKVTSTTSSQGTQVEQNTEINKCQAIIHEYWQLLLNRYSTSVYLENKGSVARDHLANERTYLAWLRTSLSTISVGIGITQLFRFERSRTHNPPIMDQKPPFFNGQMIGILFILASILFLLFAFIRYFHTQVALAKGYFPASRSTVAIASCILFFTMILILISVAQQ